MTCLLWDIQGQYSTVCCGCVLNTGLLSQWWRVCCETFRVKTVQCVVAVCWKPDCYHSDDMSVVRRSGSTQYSRLWLSVENWILITVTTFLFLGIQDQNSTVCCGCLLKTNSYHSDDMSVVRHSGSIQYSVLWLSVENRILITVTTFLLPDGQGQNSTACCVSVENWTLITETKFLLQDGQGQNSTLWCGCLLKTRLLSQRQHVCCRTVRDHEVHCDVAVCWKPDSYHRDNMSVAGRSGTMKYTVLWLPQRYRQLYAYLGALLVIPFIVFILYIFVYVNKTHRRWYFVSTWWSPCLAAQRTPRYNLHWAFALFTCSWYCEMLQSILLPHGIVGTTDYLHRSQTFKVRRPHMDTHAQYLELIGQIRMGRGM